jgi:hypothetical protein
VAKLVACLLAAAALWVRIHTSLKNYKIRDISNRTHSSPPKNYAKKLNLRFYITQILSIDKVSASVRKNKIRIAYPYIR